VAAARSRSRPRPGCVRNAVPLQGSRPTILWPVTTHTAEFACDFASFPEGSRPTILWPGPSRAPRLRRVRGDIRRMSATWRRAGPWARRCPETRPDSRTSRASRASSPLSLGNPRHRRPLARPARRSRSGHCVVRTRRARGLCRRLSGHRWPDCPDNRASTEQGVATGRRPLMANRRPPSAVCHPARHERPRLDDRSGATWIKASAARRSSRRTPRGPRHADPAAAPGLRVVRGERGSARAVQGERGRTVANEVDHRAEHTHMGFITQRNLWPYVEGRATRRTTALRDERPRKGCAAGPTDGQPRPWLASRPSDRIAHRGRALWRSKGSKERSNDLKENVRIPSTAEATP
jgi:hypothetical protein